MTVKGGTSPACAACKYQRRKCSSDCPLAPYFPANQHKSFQNAHRLFGVSKIGKILEQLNSVEHREEAMKSIKYESDMRERYPVYGCAGIINHLRRQLRQAMEELHHVYAQLAFYRQQQQFHDPSNDDDDNQQQKLGLVMGSSDYSLGTNVLDFPAAYFQHHINSGCSNVNNHEYENMPFTMDYFMGNENYNDHNDDDDHGEGTVPLMQLAGGGSESAVHVYNNNNNGDHDDSNYCDLMMMRDRNMINSSSVGVVGINQAQVLGNSDHGFGIINHQPAQVVKAGFLQDYHDQDHNMMLQFSSMVDDRQSYVETKEAAACESSSAESSFRVFPQPVSEMESELRTAAACFTLTSVN